MAVRAFLAVGVPDDIRGELMALVGRIRASGADAVWTPPENLHITLRFLGAISLESRRAYWEEWTTLAVGGGSFELSLQGTGAFPEKARPSVVWAGVADPAGGLTRLNALAETAAQRAGWPAETRPFHPHITLARLKSGTVAAAVARLLEEMESYTGGAWRASHVSLLASELTPTGAVYHELETIAFD